MPTTNIDKLYLGDILLCAGAPADRRISAYGLSSIESVSTMENITYYDQYFVMSNSGVIETDL